MNLAFSLRKEPLNERLKNLRKKHVNGEKWIVATKKETHCIIITYKILILVQKKKQSRKFMVKNFEVLNSRVKYVVVFVVGTFPVYVPQEKVTKRLPHSSNWNVSGDMSPSAHSLGAISVNFCYSGTNCLRILSNNFAWHVTPPLFVKHYVINS